MGNVDRGAWDIEARRKELEKFMTYTQSPNPPQETGEMPEHHAGAMAIIKEFGDIESVYGQSWYRPDIHAMLAEIQRLRTASSVQGNADKLALARAIINLGNGHKPGSFLLDDQAAAIDLANRIVAEAELLPETTAKRQGVE